MQNGMQNGMQTGGAAAAQGDSFKRRQQGDSFGRRQPMAEAAPAAKPTRRRMSLMDSALLGASKMAGTSSLKSAQSHAGTVAAAQANPDAKPFRRDDDAPAARDGLCLVACVPDELH